MTPGCYICDPAAFFSDEEPCMACFMRWDRYYRAVYDPATPPKETPNETA